MNGTSGDQQHKVALITGASGGIGRAICEGLLDAGFIVVGTGRSVRAGVRLLRFSLERMDVTDEVAVHSTVQSVLRRHGRVDLLVNNAGVCVIEEIADAAVQSWRDTFDVNVFGALAVSQAVLPDMRSRGSGRIINIGSQAGRYAERANGFYCASKAALQMLTRTLAMELEGSGIVVNSVSPGPVDTPMLHRSAEAIARRDGGSAESVLARFRQSTLSRRLLRVDEISAVVVFLATEGSSGISGADIPVTLGAASW